MRVIVLSDARQVEVRSGERMSHPSMPPGPPQSFRARIADMLRDARTWTTLAYFVLALPLGIAYFVIAVTGLSVGLALTFAPLFEVARRIGWVQLNADFSIEPAWLGSALLLPVCFAIGVLIVTLLMHVARFSGRMHARFAKHMLVMGS